MPTIWEILNMPAPTPEPPPINKQKKSNKSSNNALNAAKERKDDEYYTRLQDIESECSHFIEQFKDKIIYMPCDNPKLSQFWHYFHTNFSAFGLRKIICSFYDGTDNTYSIEYFGGNDADLTCGKLTPMGTGDFRNAANAKYFDEADIVVTNPPFSLFREFIATLQAHNNDFLIIGNMNACTYKEFFPLIRDNKASLSYGCTNGHMFFRLGRKGDIEAEKKREAEIIARASSSAITVPTAENNPKKTFRQDEFGHPFAAVTAWWYTTLKVNLNPEGFGKPAAYSPTVHPHYDNYDAIEVGKLKNLPYDYFESFAVPTAYKDKFNANFAIKPAPWCDGPLQTKLSDGIRLIYDTSSGLCLPTTSATLDADKQLLISLGIPETDIAYRSGVMGVPITYLEKHNPDIFDFLGCTHSRDYQFGHIEGTTFDAYVNGRRLYNRLLIRRIALFVDPK